MAAGTTPVTSYGSDLILARLQGLHPKTIDLALGRIERLLALLGHPERQLAPAVHIAGTNGKGSTLAMLDAMLQAEGHRVQRYISPHLVRFDERILFDGRPIAEAELAGVLDLCERANGNAPITFFEITTAAAFVAFARRPADVLLLETGLGGRLDATNVIERPRLTALAPIALDHQAFLGERLEQIAFEKAGILKPGVACIVGPQDPAALAVIEARAAAIGAPLILHGRDWQAWRAGERLQVELSGCRLDLPLPALPGCHQIDNGGLAVACALALGALAPAEEALATGLRKVHWPARLQLLDRGPLARLLPPGSQLWLDGGHNPAAGQALAASLNGAAADPRPLHLVVGMLSTKDESGFLKPLAPLARSLTTVPVPHEPASRDPAEAAALVAELGFRARPAGDVESALGAIAGAERRPARVLICGSLYLAGHVLRSNG
ncbi:MAG: bifunctional folylpolyglutamate synthase/dihydrofolate synthase [Geminicoccaceae bacterium]|nr:bifunctional folylpolyglutamate synthase/dihydrofolate synthase [Geminicoccaceae bacterium]